MADETKDRHLRNKENLLWFFEDVINGKVDPGPGKMGFAPGYTFNGQPFSGDATGVWIKDLHQENPKFLLTVERILAEEDMVAIWWIATGMADTKKYPEGKWSGINVVTLDDDGDAMSNWEGDLPPGVIPNPTR